MTAPVPEILDLWASGLSGSKIGERLGISRRTVTTVVHQAREVGDPRAVVHVGRNGAPIGHPDRGRRVLLEHPDVELVPALPVRSCKHGHARTPENVDKTQNCRECVRERHRAVYWRAKA